jgi:hypothetical protein
MSKKPKSAISITQARILIGVTIWSGICGSIICESEAQMIAEAFKAIAFFILLVVVELNFARDKKEKKLTKSNK